MNNKNIIKISLLALTMVAAGCGEDSDSGYAYNRPWPPSEIRNIYLAGPFFNDTEVDNVEYVENILEEKGLSYFSPMRHTVDAKPGTTKWAKQIFQQDREGIESADAVVALYYGNTSDSGTAWECGYAYSIGKPVVLVHVYRDGDSNVMMHCGCWSNIYLDELEDYDFQEMPVYEYKGKMFKEEY